MDHPAIVIVEKLKDGAKTLDAVGANQVLAGAALAEWALGKGSKTSARLIVPNHGLHPLRKLTKLDPEISSHSRTFNSRLPRLSNPPQRKRSHPSPVHDGEAQEFKPDPDCSRRTTNRSSRSWFSDYGILSDQRLVSATSAI